MSSQSGDVPLADMFGNIKKRKKQPTEDRNTKQKLSQINEHDELIQGARRSPSKTRMFDSFNTVSLGRDDSDNVVVEGPVVVPSKPSQKEKEVLQAEHEHHEKTNDDGVEVEVAEVEVPPRVEDVIQEESQPEPLVVIMPIQPELLVVIMPLQPKQQSGRTTEDPGEPTGAEPESVNMQILLEPELTLKPWLHPEAETSAAKGTIESAEEMIISVLMSMNQEDQDQDGNQSQQPKDQDQCNTPEAAPVSMEERCLIWATMDNENKYETIFQLRGPNTIEAIMYNFMTMAPATCIDMVMVSLMCHILNREQIERFQRDVYCVLPEILIRMFDTYGTNYLDKKTKMSYLVTELKDQQYMELLDKEKLRKHSTLFATVLYSYHWWLYVLDVENKEFYIVDSMFGIAPNQQRNKLHRFACNMLNQLRMWAGAPSLMKKQTISLQLRCVDVPKQPNPMDCGVYVMKWMKLLEAAALSGAYTFKIRYDIED
ncbi:hypothetical protein PIB30_053393 [Stylosanthes scabra]|uniref:Ubiquitin-like protease family profile domain-containing protein n=1 Tax=Stylosanthes scabra TaxID=79078 RepID=A0ABU6TKI5_9FABA|nr:hypothetical protein [Stylosanthes scabra]